MLLRKFLHGGKPTPIVFGTLGMFTEGTGTTFAFLYTWATDVVATTTALTTNSALAAGAGTPSKAVISLNYNAQTGGTPSTTTNTYTYAGAIVVLGTALQATNTGYALQAAGNATTGIFALHSKYTYAGDTVSTATAVSNLGGAACGIATAAIFARGNTTLTSQKYTYAGDVVAAATSFASATQSGAAFGNATYGIWVLFATPATNKYTWSSDVVTAATSIAGTRSGSASGAGNDTAGVFYYSPTSGMLKYTYAGEGLTAATALTNSANGGAAVSNGVSGVNV